MNWLPPPPPASSFQTWPSPAEDWAPLVNSARELRKRVQSGGHLTDARAHARAVLEADDEPGFRDHAARGPGMRRAILTVWTEDRDLAQRTMSIERINTVAGEQVGLSRMGLLQFLALHLEHFSSVQQWDGLLFNSIQHALQSQASRMLHQRTSGVLQTLTHHTEVLTGTAAPHALARRAADTGQPLDEVFKTMHLEPYRNTEFGTAAVTQYFLAAIEDADPSLPHDFLSELQDTSLTATVMPDGRAFGHHAVEALASKSTVPCETWVDAILGIAGDPRLKQSSTWVQWWREISAQAHTSVTAWLSRRDLELFLTAFETFTQEAHLEDAQRMFEDRRHFITGLLEEGLIKETRLFLGGVALGALERQLDRDFTATITEILGNRQEAGPKAVVAMDCGSFQLVEGSHNFQLWVYTGERVEQLFDRSRRHETLPFLRSEVPRLAETGSTGGRRRHQSFRHKGSTWQVNALRFLVDRGIQVPSLKRLMPRATYNEYRRRHGTPFDLL